ncbi:hypothetical protein NEF87_002412 [Candidatus Lokiarchaeum ossiferum]|uniref:CDP-2,3-bis-(O-geranylgeranyl)-sn-glycerol synthase n=1 Tax=Candidatus Lokiarchaeum ossiferum TaxID=2951803 RepID=A0ABY6HRI4_9ARCH|nr:hypothetical protein NEF87_002412 [Candidatus Lokiarchaeum sp. B-35]
MTLKGSRKKSKSLSPKDQKNKKIAQILCIAGIVGILIQFLYFFIKYGRLSDWWCIVIYWIIFIMPGYLADAMMVVVGGGRPLDNGKLAKDGRRLFGPGKSLRGFLLGPLTGGLIALGIHTILYWQWGTIETAVVNFVADPNVFYNFYNNDPDLLLADLSLYLLGDKSSNPSLLTFLKLIPRVFLCAYGAALGDLFGSWAKRRKNIERGQPFWIVDQIDFLSGCLILAGWFVFLPISAHVPHVLIMMIIITPTITILANNLSYMTGHKSVPW